MLENGMRLWRFFARITMGFSRAIRFGWPVCARAWRRDTRRLSPEEEYGHFQREGGSPGATNPQAEYLPLFSYAPLFPRATVNERPFDGKVAWRDRASLPLSDEATRLPRRSRLSSVTCAATFLDSVPNQEPNLLHYSTVLGVPSCVHGSDTSDSLSTCRWSGGLKRVFASWSFV